MVEGKQHTFQSKVVVLIDKCKVCIMLDSNIRSFYIFTSLLTKLGLNLIPQEKMSIEQLYDTFQKMDETFKISQVSCTCNPTTLGAEFQNSMDSVLVGVYGPTRSWLIVGPPIMKHKEIYLSKKWCVAGSYPTSTRCPENVR